MLFNSPVFIFLYLPIVIAVYFFLNSRRLVLAGKAWLVVASLFFYGWWNPAYLSLILVSILVNFVIGSSMQRGAVQQRKGVSRRVMLLLGIVFNVGILAYFKYADFFISNVNALLGTQLPLLQLLLPLAISFFTFQQIAYLVDCYDEGGLEYDFLNYCLFVTFFPQLIAGPIVHHKEMMPQFSTPRNYFVNWKNMSIGLFIFAIGLFKKVYIADDLSIYPDTAYPKAELLTFFDAWVASLSYTLQLYFDFSGYTDMAIGAALMLNIRLPLNFNSPYKAVNIQDFWRRWHMTLSRWLRDYLYIPLGGNKRGQWRTYTNLFATFLIGGLWHGAGWPFVIWGALHGAAATIHKAWQAMGLSMNRYLGGVLTFFFVHFAWVFFRADSTSQAVSMFKALFGLNGFMMKESYARSLEALTGLTIYNPLWASMEYIALTKGAINRLIIFSLIVFLAPNSIQLAKGQGWLSFKASPVKAVMLAAILAIALTTMLMSRGTAFLYFNF